MALLQELEEQRVKLEQMLLEAQQEREHLKAAVRAREQQAQRRQPQSPVQGVPAVTPGPFAEVSSHFTSLSLREKLEPCPCHFNPALSVPIGLLKLGS